MQAIVNIVSGTPLWVWLVLAYIIYVGINATQTRDVPILKLFIVPFILISVNYHLFFSKYLLLYITTLLLGSITGYFLTKKKSLAINSDAKTVTLPGSYQLLAVLLIFFSIKYLFGYLDATQPNLSQEYLWINICISGLLPSFYLGRAIYCLACMMKR